MRWTWVAAAATVAMAAGCTSAKPPHPAGPVTSASAGQLPAAYAAFSAGLSHPKIDSLYPAHGTDAVDVLHYGLDLSWSPTTRQLTGTATVQIRPVRDAASVSLDFKPYHLDRVTVDGRPAPSAVRHEKLVVTTTVRTGRPITLVVAYHGKPSQTAMPSVRGDAEPLGLTPDPAGGAWTMQEPFGAYTWYPVNDQPSDKALYDIAITVPAGWSGIAGGTPLGRTGNTFRYRSADPVASYLTTLAIGKYRETRLTGPRGIPVTLWYHDDEKQYLPLLKHVPSYLTWLEKRFGPYPFPSAGMVLVNSLSAMETQQMVTLGNAQLQRGTKSYDLNALHEFSHHWFGDTVTPTDWQDLWLNEGWALYAQQLYARDVYHVDPAKSLKDNRTLDARYRRQFGPPGKPRAADFATVNVYVGGAGMLRQLNEALGDQRFFAMATGWVQQHRDTNQDRASFIAYVNQFTGHDFTRLIDTWLDSPTVPPETGPLPA